MGADIEFLMPDRDVQRFPKTVVTTRRHSHPGGAYSFRIEGYGRTVVISTDIEHENGIDEDAVAFAKGADLLVHDAQYTDGDYEMHYEGWGHSTWSHAVEAARATGARRLVLISHDPSHSDDAVDQIVADARLEFEHLDAAREGMVLPL